MTSEMSGFLGAQSVRSHAELGLTPDPTVLADVLEHWSAPGRFYHAVEHLRRGLEGLDGGGSELGLVRLAWFFHDAIYVVGRSDNETLSAEWLDAYARGAGLDEALVRRAADLILFTRDHQGATSDDPFWPVMNDIDLAVFAAHRETYDRYADNVWREYAAVAPRQQFVLGRAMFMTAFISRPIFLTPAMLSREPVAHANITAEVERLQEEAAREGWLNP